MSGLPALCREPITSFEGAKAWIDALVAADLDFHFEDDPGTIINLANDIPIFLASDVPLIRERVATLYGYDWGDHECPIGYQLDRIDARDARVP